MGVTGGLLASALMYPLLFAAARGTAIPPERFAARLLGRVAPAPNIRVAGALLQLLFGAFWGIAAAVLAHRWGPLGGSHAVQGLLVGTAAFAVSLGGFVGLGLIPRPVDWREWTGHFLSHLVFGLLLGAAFLTAGLAAR